MLDHDGLLPCYAVITDGKKHEVTVTRKSSFTPGTILVFDCGYTDYAWFEQLTADRVFFVTRLNSNADYFVVEDRSLPQRQGLLRDQIICLTQQATNEQPTFLPRVEFHDSGRTAYLLF